MSFGEIKYAFVYALSALGLTFERFWHGFWPALSVLAAFLGVSCLNILTSFGPAAHLAMLFAFTAAFSIACTRFGARFRFPRAREIRRAIELESALRHRPLEAMLDKPVEGTDPAAQKLWASYQERLVRIREDIRTYRPKPNVAHRDPYSLRIAAAVLLALGLLTAQHDAWFRIRQGLYVDVTQFVHMKPVALDAWITPPDYTSQNPVFLATTQLGASAIKGSVTVPEGSLLKVRLSGYDAPPHVTYAEGETPAFAEPAPHNFTMEMPLTKDGELKIKKGWFRTLGKWHINVTPDQPPQITFLGVEKGDRATLKIKYKVSDDYGVRKIYGVISPTPELQKLSGGRTIDFDIPVPDDMHADEQVYVADLASHPWAGSPVMLSLNAVDAAGHLTETPAQKITLPERDFQNPTAKRIIAERKRLIWYDNLITERLVTQAIAEIASVPANYKYDLITFLGLDMAAKRLMYDGGPEAVNTDIALLWDLAVRVEDGGLSLAQRELSDALQRLSEGLKDKSMSKDDLQKLMDDVQQKMREYVKTLAQEMQQRMRDGKQSPQLSQDLAEKLMKKIDMGKLMEQLKNLQSGTEREQMEKMAQFMKNSIDNYDPAKMDRMQQQQRKAMEALNQLQKLIERQQALLDKTNKMQPKQGQQPPQDQQNQQQQQQDQQQSGNDGQQDQQQQSGDKGQQDQQQRSGDNGQQDQQQQSRGDQQGQQQGQQQQSGGQQQGQQQQPGGEQQGQQQQAGGQQQGQQQQPGGQQQGQQQQPGGQQQGQQQQPGGQQQGQQQQPGGEQQGQQQQPGGQQQGQQQQPGGQQPGQQQSQGGQNGTSGQQSGQQQTGQSGASQPGMAGSGQDQTQGTQGGMNGQQQSAQGPGGQHGQAIPQNGGQDKGQAFPDPVPSPQATQQAGAGDGGKEKFPEVKTPKEGAAEQGNIRGKLGDILRDLSSGMQDIPEQFSKADQAMKSSQNALKDGNAQGSAPSQREALENLQKAEDQALEQMAKGLQMMLSMGMMPNNGSGDGSYGDGFDPLGRDDGNGKFSDKNIKIPDEKERRRVQQIIEELRSRSNEYNRPKIERDYIDRLLEQFD